MSTTATCKTSTSATGSEELTQAVRQCQGPSVCRGSSCSRPQLPEEFRRRKTVLADWLPALIAMLFLRKLSGFVRLWAAFNADVRCQGLENVPVEGSFVLAVNHIKGIGLVPSLIAATLRALALRRPASIDEVVAVAGTRTTPAKMRFWARIWRSVWRSAKRRWSANLLEVAMAGEQSSARALLQWRRVALSKPSFVFPEGVGRPLFGPIRDGSGAFLSSLSVPTVPVAVWWHEKQWHVRFGEPVNWSKRRELHDVQLGLSVAELLPTLLVDRDWRQLLRRRAILRQNS